MPNDTGSITPSLGGEVVLKSILHPFFNRVVKVLHHAELTRGARATLAQPAGRGVPPAVVDKRGPRRFNLTIATPDVFDRTSDPLLEAGDLDIIFASGDIFYIHIPQGRSVPGGYVLIENMTEDRIVRAGDDAPRIFTLTCVNVAPPGPDVTGTTLVYGTLERLYGNGAALMAAHATGRALHQTIGDPEDAVVI